VFRKAADLAQQSFAELALYVARETGGALFKGEHEVREAIVLLHQAAGLLSQPHGLVLPSAAGRLSYARRQPHGVVGVISPFNFPLVLSLRSVAPALAAGNAVVLKPDPQTPVSGGFLIARLFEEAGLPKGLLQVLPGAAPAGEALCRDPNVQMIAFTGSTAAGRKVAEVAGRHLKKVALELGGKNPLIILEDADLDLAASNAAWGAWLHQGQICMATGLILAHESIVERLTRKLVDKARALTVGNAARGEAALGPLINQRQLQRVHEIVSDSLQAAHGWRRAANTTNCSTSPPCSAVCGQACARLRMKSSGRWPRWSVLPPTKRPSSWPTAPSMASRPRSSRLRSGVPWPSASGLTAACCTSMTRPSPTNASTPLVGAALPVMAAA